MPFPQNAYVWNKHHARLLQSLVAAQIILCLASVLGRWPMIIFLGSESSFSTNEGLFSSGHAATGRDALSGHSIQQLQGDSYNIRDWQVHFWFPRLDPELANTTNERSQTQRTLSKEVASFLTVDPPALARGGR